MLLYIAQAAAPAVPEPPPSGWAATGDKILSAAERHPDTFWPVVACLIPLAMLGGVLFVVVKWVIPAWREELEKNRLHLAGIVKARGDEAAADLAAGRELARVQHEAIVLRVETKIDTAREDLRRSSDRIDRISEQLARVSAKIAVAVFFLATLSGATCR